MTCCIHYNIISYIKYLMYDYTEKSAIQVGGCQILSVAASDVTLFGCTFTPDKEGALPETMAGKMKEGTVDEN